MEAGLQPEEQFRKDTFERTAGGRVEWDNEEGEPVLQTPEAETDRSYTGRGQARSVVTKGRELENTFSVKDTAAVQRLVGLSPSAAEGRPDLAAAFRDAQDRTISC